MNPLFQFTIPKRKLNCSLHGERFIPGQEIISLLVDEKKKEVIREDFCTTCWNKKKIDGDLKGNQLYWKSKIEEKKGGAASNRIERALQLFITEAALSPPAEEELFFLALFLARSRQIALRKEIKKEGISYNLYEVLRDQQFLMIKVIDLSKIDISAIQTTLAEKLNGE